MYVRRKHSLKPSCLETRISEEDQEKRAMMRLEIAREQKLLMKSQLGVGVASYGGGSSTRALSSRFGESSRQRPISNSTGNGLKRSFQISSARSYKPTEYGKSKPWESTVGQTEWEKSETSRFQPANGNLHRPGTALCATDRILSVKTGSGGQSTYRQVDFQSKDRERLHSAIASHNPLPTASTASQLIKTTHIKSITDNPKPLSSLQASKQNSSPSTPMQLTKRQEIQPQGMLITVPEGVSPPQSSSLVQKGKKIRSKENSQVQVHKKLTLPMPEEPEDHGMDTEEGVLKKAFFIDPDPEEEMEKAENGDGSNPNKERAKKKYKDPKDQMMKVRENKGNYFNKIRHYSRIYNPKEKSRLIFGTREENAMKAWQEDHASNIKTMNVNIRDYEKSIQQRIQTFSVFAFTGGSSDKASLAKELDSVGALTDQNSRPMAITDLWSKDFHSEVMSKAEHGRFRLRIQRYLHVLHRQGRGNASISKIMLEAKEAKDERDKNIT
jgi:hypothetical protein